MAHVRRQQEVKSKLDAYRESKKQGLRPSDEPSEAHLHSESVGKEPSEPRESSAPRHYENASSTSPWYVTVLKILLWLVLWGFFIEVQFGAVFFVSSALFLLYWSLRGSRRKPWEPSAYSVFNKNFEAIEGTLTAEQFEKELRYGPTSVK